VTQSTRDERLRRLYETTRRPLLAYAVRRTASPEDAADVVAETFVIAMRRLDDIPEGEMELLWLYGTARGVVANFKRRAQLRSRPSKSVPWDSGWQPSTQKLPTWTLLWRLRPWPPWTSPTANC